MATDQYPKTEAPIKSLKPGWAEQNPEDWVDYVKEATRAILASSGVAPADIKAIGFSYQMHGLVAIDREDACFATPSSGATLAVCHTARKLWTNLVLTSVCRVC